MTLASPAVRALGRALAVLTALHAVGTRSAHAQRPSPTGWHEQLKAGYELKQQGNCIEAIPHFLESLGLEVQTKTLMHLADCEERVARLTLAREHWTRARDRARAEDNARFAADAAFRLQALDERIPRLLLALPPTLPDETQVELDGVRLEREALGRELLVDPGTHRIALRAPDRTVSYYELLLNPRETRRLEVQLGAPLPKAPQHAGPAQLDVPARRAAPAAAPATPRQLSAPTRLTRNPSRAQLVAGWITFGAGLGITVASGVSGLIVAAKYPEVRDCTGPCDSTAGEPRAEVLRAIAGLVVGGVIAASGVALVLTAPSSKTNAGRPANVAANPGSGSVVSLTAKW